MVNVGRTSKEEYGLNLVSWSGDGKICAVGNENGWQMVWPASRRVQRISSTKVWYLSQPEWAWAPGTQRLAVAEGSGSYRLKFWDGGRQRRGANWADLLKFPDWYRSEATPTTLEWSTDGRALMLQFYGHAERMPDSAQHSVVFSVEKGRVRHIWGDETKETHWLDGRRLMYGGDDEGMGGPTDLVVAEPRTHKRRVWKRDVLTWALSPRRDFVCALTSKGDLIRTPTGRPQWEFLRRKVIPRPTSGESAPALQISPRGEMVALWNGGRMLRFYSTSGRRPWMISWKTPASSVGVVGWAKGQTLPIVKIHSGEKGGAALGQLLKTSPE